MFFFVGFLALSVLNQLFRRLCPCGLLKRFDTDEERRSVVTLRAQNSLKTLRTWKWTSVLLITDYLAIAAWSSKWLLLLIYIFFAWLITQLSLLPSPAVAVIFAFFLVSIFSALLVASFFDLWHTDNVVEAWAEFTQTDLLTAKKALYLLLMFQMALYLLYTIVEVDWSMLLVVIAGYYLDAKKRNFMLMYLVIVSVTVLLDVIKIAAMPNLNSMTPGMAFGAVLYFLIFLLKFAIIGAIYLYQRKEDAHPTAFAFSQMPDGAGRGDDEIAE